MYIGRMPHISVADKVAEEVQPNFVQESDVYVKVSGGDIWHF